MSTGGGLDVDQVIGRDDVIAGWWRDLEGGSLRLNEPRRLGKSAALVRMVSAPPAGWSAIYTSFQEINTLDALVSAVLRSLHNHRGRSTRIRDRMRQYLHGDVSVDVLGVHVGLNPVFAAQPLHALELALDDVVAHLDDGERLLLAWDEVPDMIRGIQENEGAAAARALLLAIRRFVDGPGGRRVRWIMTGSVGFHHVLHELPGTDSLLNNIGAAALGPLTPGWAAWLAASLYLGEGISVEPAVPREAARITDGIPFLVQHLVKHARDARLPAVVASDLVAHFDAFAADEDSSQQMTAMLTRLPDYYGTDVDATEWILDRVAERPLSRVELIGLGGPLPASDSAVRDLLRRLKLDHYLEQDLGGQARYRWRYPALARIWRIRRR